MSNSDIFYILRQSRQSNSNVRKNDSLWKRNSSRAFTIIYSIFSVFLSVLICTDDSVQLSKLISEREASNNIEKELQGTVHEQKGMFSYKRIEQYVSQPLEVCFRKAVHYYYH